MRVHGDTRVRVPNQAATLENTANRGGADILHALVLGATHSPLNPMAAVVKRIQYPIWRTAH